MASSEWGVFYEETQQGGQFVPAGNYEFEIVTARPWAQSRMLYLGLEILTGPEAGKVPEVGLYIPDRKSPKYRGQSFNFRKKVRGFGDLSAAFAQMPDDDLDKALTILAEAMIGVRASGEIGQRSDGEYSGTNELVETKPADDAVAAPSTQAAPVASVAAPASVAAAAPAPAEPVAEAAEPF